MSSAGCEKNDIDEQVKRVALHWFMKLFHMLVNSMKSESNHKTLLCFKDIRAFENTSWRQFYGEFKDYFYQLWTEIQKLDDVTISREGSYLNICVRLAYLARDEEEMKNIFESSTLYKKEEMLLEQVQHGSREHQDANQSETPRNCETESKLLLTPDSEESTEPMFETEELVLDENFKIDVATKSWKTEIENQKERIKNSVTLLEFRTGLEREESEEKHSDTDGESQEDYEDQLFKIRLEQQQREHHEQMEQKKREQRERQAAFLREMQEVRKRNRQRFLVFFECMRLKMRFEEEERKWAEWLESDCRYPIRQCLYYLDNMPDLKEELFRWKLEELMDKLQCNFEGLGEMADVNEEALFIRLVQMNLCDVANKLIKVLDCLEYPDTLEILDLGNHMSLVSDIKPTDILCTSELRAICKISKMSEFEKMQFPVREVHVKIEEVQEGGNTEKDDNKDEDSMEIIEPGMNPEIRSVPKQSHLDIIGITSEKFNCSQEEEDKVDEKMVSVGQTEQCPIAPSQSSERKVSAVKRQQRQHDKEIRRLRCESTCSDGLAESRRRNFTY